MDLKLKVLQGANAGQEVPVNVGKFFIGRSEDCHLRPASEMISRHHCALLMEDGYVAVLDFGSRNGTYVNDQRVVGQSELKAGDRLTVGPLEFEVVIKHKVGGKKRPPVSGFKEAVERAAAAPAPQVDVGQWLDDGPNGSSTTDTQRVRVDQAVGGSLDDTQPTLPIDTMAGKPAESVASEGKPSSGKKVYGKLPPIPKQETKDSREAAMQMLDQLRKRR